MRRIAAIVILGSLVLLGSCADNPTDLPNVQGYSGYMTLGWNAYNDGNFQQALDYFKEAIDIDPSKARAYIGAGWSTLYLPDYWRVADEYFYMAMRNHVGYYPISSYTESQTQDTMWTTFQCLSPDLPNAVLNPILENTADSGIVWVGEQINDIVAGAALPFRFKPLNMGVNAIFGITNSYTTVTSAVDSIRGGWVYVTVPMATMEIGGDDYYTWIGAAEQINYDYRIFDQSGSPGGQYFLDALAGTCVLQDIRGENGDALLGCSAAWALDKISDNYQFGNGTPYAGYESINNMQVKGLAAAQAFANQYFRFAWFTCLSKDMGTGLDPESATFVTDLMQVIETMLGS